MSFDEKCKKCNNPIVRIDEFQANACRTCNEWTEDKCSDRCEFCDERPDTPENCNWSW